MAMASISASNRPLGTADWKTFKSDMFPGFSSGDTLLGWTDDGKPIGHRDGRNVLVVAGPRSHKGTSFIVPHALFWPGSMLVNDPKGENAMITARARGLGSQFCKGRGQKTYVFDPYGIVQTPWDDFADIKVRFNALDMLDPNDEESVPIAAAMAEALINPDDAKGEGAEWRHASSKVFADISLHVASDPGIEQKDRNLGTVRRLLVEGERALAELATLNSPDGATVSGLEMLFRTMMKNPAFGGIVAEAGAMYLDTLLTAPRQMTGMLFSARNATQFLDDAKMRRALSRSDFSLDALKTDPRGVTLFVTLPQRYMGSHGAIMRLFVLCALTRMEQLAFQPRSGHPVLMILDEFAGLRRMKPVEEAAAQINAHGVKMAFIVQSLAQLKEVYKDNWETLMASCGAKLFFNNEDQFTREYVSKLAGETEVVRSTENASQTNGSSQTSSTSNGWSSSRTVTNSYTTGNSSSANFGASFGGSSGTSHSSTTSVASTVGASGSTSVSRGSSVSLTEGTATVVHKRQLLNPDEVGRLFGDSDETRALALCSGSQPLSVRRLPYFKVKALEGRYDPHPDHPAPPTLIEREGEQTRLLQERRRQQEDAARMQTERQLAQENAERSQRQQLIMRMGMVGSTLSGGTALLLSTGIQMAVASATLPVLVAGLVALWVGAATGQPTPRQTPEEIVASANRMWGRQ